jgi:hypothetical protein
MDKLSSDRGGMDFGLLGRSNPHIAKHYLAFQHDVLGKHDPAS